MISDGNVLRAVSEIRRDKGESSGREAESRGESCEKNLVVNGVECSR